MTKDSDLDWLSRNPLRAHRKRLKPSAMTQDEAARQIGCSLSTIRLWERGTGMPQIESMRRIGKLIGAKSLDRLSEDWMRWREQKVRPAVRAA